MRFAPATFRWIVLVTAIMVLCSDASPAGSETDTIVIASIHTVGNRRTQEYIILRELTFSAGDTLTGKQLEQALKTSQDNLMRLSLFHFADFSVHPSPDSKGTDISISLTERWYTWLWPVFEIADRNPNAWLENGDFRRISYGLFFQQENFRGRMEKLHLRFKAGYQQQLGLLYEAPYLNRKKTLGAGIMVTLGRERETAIKTLEDRLIYHRDEDFLRWYTGADLFLRYRPGIHHSHTLTAQLNRFRFSDTLLSLNPDYAGTGDEKVVIPRLSYLLKADFRDQRGYPLRGWYADALLEWTGILPFSEFNYLTLRSSARKHVPLHGRWNLAAGAAIKISTAGTKPWFLNQAMGYGRDYVRGYEYKVLDGDNFWITKVNLKYALLNEKIVWLNRIKAKQFNTIPFSVHAGVYADAGQVWTKGEEENTGLKRSVLTGAGLGLDFVTYYDKVVRTEFSVNREGQAGFFVHFMAAI